MNSIKALISQFLKFGVVGVSNTLITLAVYYILKYIGMNYIAAYSAGFLLGVVNSYFWNNRYVFKKSKEGNVEPFLKVLTINVAMYLLSTFLLYVIVQRLGISDKIAPIITLFVTVPINFLLNKFWAFK